MALEGRKGRHGCEARIAGPSMTCAAERHTAMDQSQQSAGSSQNRLGKQCGGQIKKAPFPSPAVEAARDASTTESLDSDQSTLGGLATAASRSSRAWRHVCTETIDRSATVATEESASACLHEERNRSSITGNGGQAAWRGGAHLGDMLLYQC